MGGEAAIQAALYRHLKATKLPVALPIAPEGRNFDPKGRAYLRSTFLPAETTSFGTESDGDIIYGGLFQIDVFWPVNEGLTRPLTHAAMLAARFCRGTRLTANDLEVRIDQPASVLGAQQEPNWLHIPVRARWAVYAGPPSTV
ncbi:MULTISPECIES: phage tail terminator-like protein [Methylobacterium]|uniref:Uncharacterized protein n=1 Tax=Methylobacterium fujisawaense TaxID=107400 RepID=A0ABR6DF00_9HYPH|nr:MULTISPECIES: phage tail terminator-like protein [Methylobacterium]MBA9063894.1 hypothetical protein [Methylobacterium fujisawaense]MDH3027639.1 phage tail terminator-like protein [Methylobacterium fujisawaense]